MNKIYGPVLRAILRIFNGRLSSSSGLHSSSRMLKIHVGAGKTGNSAIQSFLYANRGLLEDGLNIPISDQAGTLTPHRFALTSGLTELRSHISHSKETFITSEYFHSLATSTPGRLLLRQIASLDVPKQIIFAIRRQSEWTESAVNQWLKDGNLMLSKEHPREAVNRCVNYDLVKQVDIFAEIFGDSNITLVPYEKLNKHVASVVWPMHFLTSAGVRIIGTPIPPTEKLSNHQRLHPILMEIAWECFSKTTFSPSEMRIRMFAASRILGDLLTKSRTEKARYLSPDYAHEIESRMSDGYERLALTYLKKGELFGSPHDWADDSMPTRDEISLAEQALSLTMEKHVSN